MVRARKRPDVARRIGDQLDHDLVARDTVREEAGRDRQLIARGTARASRRRTRLLAPSAPTSDAARDTLPSAVVDVERRRRSRATSVTRAATSVRARAAGGVEQQRRRTRVRLATTSAPPSVERRPSRDAVAARRRRTAPARMRTGGSARGVDRVGHERQRASGDAAAAGLLARMRGVEERHARAARARARQAVHAPAGPAPTIATSISDRSRCTRDPDRIGSSVAIAP